MNVEKIRFPSFGTSIMLEGELVNPGDSGTLYGAILCHPHPLYGGNMHNIIIVKMRDVLNELGIATIRFNFRGTGLSEGSHNDGVGEVFDILGAARYFLDRNIPSTRQIIIGYSFGAAMALNFLEKNSNYSCFVGIAVPTTFTEYLRGGADIKLPTLLITGEYDEISSLEDAVRLYNFNSVETFSVPGGNHLFTGTDPETKKSRISLVLEKSREFITRQIGIILS